MESILVVIPAEKQHGHKFSHPGEEFIYVLEGAIIANIDGEEYFVNEGDSIHFPSTIPHILSNPLKTDSKILTVVCPAIFKPNYIIDIHVLFIDKRFPNIKVNLHLQIFGNLFNYLCLI